MDIEQIKIGEDLLSFLITESGQAKQKDCLEHIRKTQGDIPINLINSTITLMIENYKLINRHFQIIDLYIISDKGIKANKIGLIKSIKRFEQKEKFEFETAKWKYYTFWLWFGIAILGFGYSCYDFIEGLTTTKTTNQEQISTTRSKESESERQTLNSTYISDQKSLDSLPLTNSE